MTLKVGHVHIPKCAGTALNQILYAAFQLQPWHITGVVDKVLPQRHLDVELNSDAFQQLSERGFVSGHLPFKQMALLDRDFIFTVLRDPFERFFSLFSYNISRALKLSNFEALPHLQGYQHKTFIEHLEFLSTRRGNSLFSLLVDDGSAAMARILEQAYFSQTEQQARQLISQSLRRFDAIYFCDQASILTDLVERGILSACPTAHVNRSEVTGIINMGCSRSEFKQLMWQHCWLDIVICEEAAKCFPDTVIYAPQSFEQFLAKIEARYQLQFTETVSLVCSTNASVSNASPTQNNLMEGSVNQFNFSSKQLVNLQQNAAHQFALNQSMLDFTSDAVYTFIPKNACSTMRLSLAIANGCIDGIEQGHWIHSNNNTFTPSLKEAFKAPYTFVFLRCPFRRLASVFLDKFVGKEVDAWLYHSARGRSFNLDDISFKDFVLSLRQQWILNSNIHWKPQHSFLLYKEYSDYFSLEEFSDATEKLKQKIKFTVVDARTLTNHGTERFNSLDDMHYAEHSVKQLANIKAEGNCPSYQAMYTPELIDIVAELYAADIALYKAKCNPAKLLFGNSNG